MGIPAPAVRQKMIMANISEADVLLSQLGKVRKLKRKSTIQNYKNLTKCYRWGSQSSNQAKDDNGFNPEAEINDFFGDNLSNGSQPSSGRKESLAPKQINPALKSLKMLSGYPKPTVKQKMVMAQISEAEIAAFLETLMEGKQQFNSSGEA